MVGSYRDLLTRQGVLPFTTAGFIGRLPKPMLTLGIVLYVTDLTGSYALAGSMSATLVLAAAFIGPFGARLMDRFGQDRVVWVLATCQVGALLGFVFAAQANVPIAVQFLLLIIAGGVDPNFGSAVRARWAYLLRGEPQLGSAFAWESVVDEIAFIVGPLLATFLALRFGAWAAIVASAGLIMIAAIWLSLLSATQPPRQPKIEAVNRQRILGPVMLVMVVAMVLMGGVFGSFEVSTVAFAQGSDQSGAMGLVLALFAAGSLLSGLTFGAIKPTAPLGRQLQFAATFVAIVVVPLPFISTIPVLAVAAFVAGLSAAPVLILTITIVERVVHASRLTEAFTITISGLAVGLAIGSTLSGALVDAHTPSAGYAVTTASGIGALAVVLVSARTLKSVQPKPPQM
jgi:MFS family permease